MWVCVWDEWEWDKWVLLWDECAWNDKDKFDKSDHGMTWVSLTRMIATWVSMRKYDKSECYYEWYKVIHFMYKIWSVT